MDDKEREIHKLHTLMEMLPECVEIRIGAVTGRRFIRLFIDEKQVVGRSWHKGEEDWQRIAPMLIEALEQMYKRRR